MMICLFTIAFTLLASTALAQRGGTYRSLGGFGNVLFPGTGHAPATPPGGVTGPYYFSNGNKHQGWRTGGSAMPSELVPAPALSPNDGLEQSSDPTTFRGDSPQTTPRVIEQEFLSGENISQPENDSTHAAHPEVPSGCESPASRTSHQRKITCSGEPTVYYLVLKDGRTVQSLGYWLRGSIIYYVSVEYALNQISLSLIDENRTQSLNAARGVEFDLGTSR